ncbi:hypothetical protein EON82_07170 [bacterium]|nr:MAG: hypothetical protein EON82_07170 [bacterium]
MKAAVIMAAFMLVMVAVGFLMIFDHRRTMGHLTARPIPDGSISDEFLAEVTIVVKGRRIGIDRGVVWFSEGLMGFSGPATSFVLAAWDVELQRVGRMATMTESAIPAGALLLVESPKPAYLLIQPLGRNRAAFRRRLIRFERESMGEDEERIWPPLHLYTAEPKPIEKAVRS